MNPIGAADLTHFRRHGWLRVPHLHDANDLAVLRETMRKGFAAARCQRDLWRCACGDAERCGVEYRRQDRAGQRARTDLYYPEVRGVCTAPQVGRIVRSLLGAERVRLFSETYLDKPPGSLPTPWHQDWPLQPFDRRDTVGLLPGDSFDLPRYPLFAA